MTQSNQTSRSTPDGSSAGERLFLDFDDVTDPGVAQIPISYTVPTGFLVNILAVEVVASYEGFATIFVNGASIGGGRTGPARPSPTEMVFFPFHSVAAGSTIEVKYTQAAYRPISELRVYLQGRKIPV